MMQMVAFSIYHDDCPACISTARFPEVELRILQSRAHGNGHAEVLQQAVFPLASERSQYLGFWKDSETVTRYGDISRTSDSSIFHVSLSSKSGWVTDAILDNGGYFLDSVTVQNGVEHWRVMIEDGNKLDLFSQLENLGTPKLESVSRVRVDELFTEIPQLLPLGLTEKQLSIIRFAIQRGYFHEPRETGSRELASELGISQSTFLEHLRKAQQKLFEAIL